MMLRAAAGLVAFPLDSHWKRARSARSPRMVRARFRRLPDGFSPVAVQGCGSMLFQQRIRLHVLTDKQMYA